MIRTFRHKGLTQLFEASGSHAVAAVLTRRLIRQLDYLNRAASARDMNLPGYYLHGLNGERDEVWGVAVSDVCRLTFVFEGSDVFDVDLEDYH
jgi:proteic killer suppression protein